MKSVQVLLFYTLSADLEYVWVLYAEVHNEFEKME